MENYIGRKCKGFRFEDGPLVRWDSEKEDYIGQVGEVVIQGKNDVTLKFDNGKYGIFLCYPISLIEEHLIPEIPQLVEGELMEVSDDGMYWFVDNYSTLWEYARPLPEVKKYTKDELVKILGHDFEIV
jgi:hypothetical protein